MIKRFFNPKIANEFFSDHKLDFRGYALYLLTLIFFTVTIVVAFYDFILGYAFDAFLELILALFSLLIFYLNITTYRYQIWIAQLFFWMIAFCAFVIVVYHHFDSTTLFLILTPIIAILILPAKQVLIDFILYEFIVSLLLYYGYHHYAAANPIIFSRLALLNYITGTLYLFTFWYFYHISIERTIFILSTLHKQKSFLLRELQHRVKNNFNLILSLLHMQANHDTSLSTKTFIDTFSKRIESISQTHELLYILNKANKANRLDIKEYIHKLTQHIVGKHPQIVLHFNLVSWYMPSDQVIYFGLILNEMLTNSLKHGIGKPCTITMTLHKNGDCLSFIYQDSLSIEKKPIKEGFGMQIIRLAAKQLDADMQIIQEESLRYILHFRCKEQ